MLSNFQSCAILSTAVLLCGSRILFTITTESGFDFRFTSIACQATKTKGMKKTTVSPRPEKSERKKRTKKPRTEQCNDEGAPGEPMDFGLAAELNSLKDDIITVGQTADAQRGDSVLVTKANKIPLTIKQSKMENETEDNVDFLSIFIITFKN